MIMHVVNEWSKHAASELVIRFSGTQFMHVATTITNLSLGNARQLRYLWP